MALLASVGLLLTGCRSFEKQWDAALDQSVDPQDLSGPWEGRWQNTNNDHGGALRALIEPESENRYRAQFHATWGKRRGRFKSTLIGHWEGDYFHFKSRRRIAGFLITTEGTASIFRFDADYHSRFDSGQFLLDRPGAERRTLPGDVEPGE